MPFGHDPIGSIIYTSEYMMVLLAKNVRTPFSSPDITKVQDQSIIANFNEFDTYCGSYRICEESQTVIHTVETARSPSVIGTEYKRFFEFSGDKLVLSTVDPIVLGGLEWFCKLTWTRSEIFEIPGQIQE